MIRNLPIADIVLITGGLGPTADDITKPVLCEYFNTSLIIDEAALENVKNIFERILKRPIIERNLKQAEVPASCRVIQNKRGTAPGMLFEKNGKVIVSMPGVPHEMKGMMTDDVIPILQRRFGRNFIAHRTLLTAGIGESALADHILDFESSLPPEIRLAYLPNYGMVRLRLTAWAVQPEGLEPLLDKLFANLKSRVGEWMVTDQDLTLQEVIGQILTSRQQSLSTAESCTGGYVAHLITSIPGSSGYFRGSVIAYDNEIKKAMLGVNPEILSAAGAVSEETVRAMVQRGIANNEVGFRAGYNRHYGTGRRIRKKTCGYRLDRCRKCKGNHNPKTLVPV